MSTLTDLIRVVRPDEEEQPEDIFASAPGVLFTDDLRCEHGDPGSTIVYQSKQFGDIDLKTCDPDSNDDRMLFSHYLWNAGVKMAEMISDERGAWSVKHERVLELGAGVGLGGIVATLAGAAKVFITDYPAPIIIDNIRTNATRAIPKLLASHYEIEGHEWGATTSKFASDHAHHFTRILAADCFWMPGQHVNLVHSMLHFLALDAEARIFAIAGFHTGRAKLASFFEVAEEEGLEIEEIYEEDAEGKRREWAKERDGGREDHTARKRWLVVTKMRRR